MALTCVSQSKFPALHYQPHFADTLDRGNTDWIINIVALNVMITFMTKVMNAALPVMMGGASDSEEWENAPFFLSCPTEN